MQADKKLRVFAWSMYDFGSTIFSMNIITLYFALWVTVDMHGEDLWYGVALSASMLLAAVSAPILGVLSDKIGRRVPFLIFFTTACCLVTAFIGFAHNLVLGLLCFAIANYCYQVADVFYNALLPAVSDGKEVGQVSGYGVSLGYCGTIIGLVLVSPFVLKWGKQAVFIPTAVLFLLSALPCFFYVKDKQMAQRERSAPKIRGLRLMARIRGCPGLLLFLVSIFLSFNAINTIFVFMSVYVKKVMGFDESIIQNFYILSSIFAIIGAFLAGYVTDKLGAKRTLVGIMLIWIVTILVAAIAKHPVIFWIIGPVIGMSLGSTWTSARALAVALSPPDMAGEVFGFYGLVGKTASIVGPLVWGLSVWGFRGLGVDKYRVAVSILCLFLFAGFVVLRKVPTCKHS